MNILVGKIVSTHGIKGEIKIISDFQFKNKVFVPKNKIIIDDVTYNIRTYRKHKNYDMVTLDDYNDINQILFLMKKKVYFNEEDLKLGSNEILDKDLLKYKVITKDGKCGIIKEIFFASQTNKILRVLFDKEVLIPLNSSIIKEISKERKEVLVELIEGM